MPTIDGMSMLNVPAFTQNGDVLRMRAKGVADPRGRGRGDQLVHVRVLRPLAMTDRQRQLLTEFDAEAQKQQHQAPGGGQQQRATWGKR